MYKLLTTVSEVVELEVRERKKETRRDPLEWLKSTVQVRSSLRVVQQEPGSRQHLYCRKDP